MNITLNISVDSGMEPERLRELLTIASEFETTKKVAAVSAPSSAGADTEAAESFKAAFGLARAKLSNPEKAVAVTANLDTSDYMRHAVALGNRYAKDAADGEIAALAETLAAWVATNTEDDGEPDEPSGREFV